MITQKKQTILEGIGNNLFAKILGYPTALMFSPFKKNVEYEIDLLKETITPNINLTGFEKDTFSQLLAWFNSEINSRRINKEDIHECKLIFKCVCIYKILWLIPINTYLYDLRLVSERNKIERHTKHFGYI